MSVKYLNHTEVSEKYYHFVKSAVYYGQDFDLITHKWNADKYAELEDSFTPGILWAFNSYLLYGMIRTLEDICKDKSYPLLKEACRFHDSLKDHYELHYTKETGKAVLKKKYARKNRSKSA